MTGQAIGHVSDRCPIDVVGQVSSGCPVLSTTVDRSPINTGTYATEYLSWTRLDVRPTPTGRTPSPSLEGCRVLSGVRRVAK